MPRESAIFEIILNKAKQIASLGRDANKEDFQIEITHETNVNVHCSTGFFLAVARPAFTGLSSGYTGVVGGIPVSLEELRSGKDQDGSGVNLVLKFKVSLQQNRSPASATVHIHNTQRMIQIHLVSGKLSERKVC